MKCSKWPSITLAVLHLSESSSQNTNSWQEYSHAYLRDSIKHTLGIFLAVNKKSPSKKNGVSIFVDYDNMKIVK